MSLSINPFHDAPYGGAEPQNSPIVAWDGLGVQKNGNALPALTANGYGSFMGLRGINGYINIEITNSGAGSCAVAVGGTLDISADASSVTSKISPVRYAVLGQTSFLAPVVAGTALASGQTIWITLLDAYPTYALNISATSGAISVAARAYVVPQ